MLFDPPCMLVNGLLKSVEESGSFPGLCYILIDIAGIDCTEKIGALRVSRQNETHRKRATVSDVTQELNPLHSWHTLVRENDIRNEAFF